MVLNILMKKLLLITITSLLLTLASQVITTKYIYVVSEGKCPPQVQFYTLGGCYAVTEAQGFPFGYIPVETWSGFDDFNPLFDGINFSLDLAFYFVLLMFMSSAYPFWLHHRPTISTPR